MTHRLVVGAGVIGRPLAERLAARGDSVTIATRSGSPVTGATALTLNASDPAAFARAAEGAATIFLCTNPPYPEWAAQWPPIFAAAIAAASESGADLVVVGNLYPYGEPSGPMSEVSPESTTEMKGVIRRDGWASVRAAADRGAFRAVEVRASDYFGPGATGNAHLGEPFFTAVLGSKTARVVGQPELVHSWSYLPDIVTTLIKAADADEWGRVWHVPSSMITRTEIVAQLNRRYGTRGKVSGYPQWMLRSLGLFSPLMREVSASSHQFEMPYVIDAADTERRLGVAATGWDEALGTTAESYRAPGR